MNITHASSQVVALSPTKLDEVRAATSVVAATSRPLLAAILGGTITRIISPLKLNQFGGFVPFMNRYLDDLIEVDPSRHALPGQLWLRRKSNAPTSADVWRDVLSLEGPSFWRHFANPREVAHFAVQPVEQQLLMSLHDTALPPGSIAIDKLTNHDYARAAESLVSQLPEFAQQDAREVLSTDGANLKWMDVLKRQAPHLLHSWSLLRVGTVFDRLATQLKNVGLSQPTLVTLEASLRRSREQNVSQRITGITPRTMPVEPAAMGDLSRLREFAKVAVLKMSEEELRGLKIPLGVLLDAIKER